MYDSLLPIPAKGRAGQSELVHPRGHILHYFPIQNLEKILSKRSSVVMITVISPK